jgi:hypothetical protein
MTQYQLTGENFVYRFREGLRTTIPLVDPGPGLPPNPDAIEYCAWLAAGGVPLPAEPVPAPVPLEVPRWAGRLALKRHVLEEGALVLLSAAEDRPTDNLLARVLTWRDGLQPGELLDRVDAVLNDAKDWLRDSETVAAVAQVLGLTAEQVDALFAWAAAQRA